MVSGVSGYLLLVLIYSYKILVMNYDDTYEYNFLLIMLLWILSIHISI
jgi:hypothetical protein